MSDAPNDALNPTEEEDLGTEDAEHTEPTEDDTEQWKTHSRKWERRAKDGKARLDAQLALYAEVSEKLTALEADLETKTNELAELKPLSESQLGELSRLKLVIEYGLSVEDASLLTLQDEDANRALAERLSKSAPPRPDPHQGKQRTAKPLTARDTFLAEFSS